MIITKKWLNSHKTKFGAWTRPQIESLGLQWPPTKGWMDRVKGTVIDDNRARAFESKVPQKVARKAAFKHGNISQSKKDTAEMRMLSKEAGLMIDKAKKMRIIEEYAKAEKITIAAAMVHFMDIGVSS